MRQNFGNGWEDRGPRKAVKVWDKNMQGCKPTVEPRPDRNEEDEL
ncbi:hypothetical protein PBI_VANISOA_54 [Mycobacterium phage Vanisoa]|nr:hypothetical protein PBI_VANISOA_54 [Mycobacterium phage Vanisoa]